MRNLDKYKGVIPAFYACYDEEGSISRREKSQGCLCKWIVRRVYLSERRR